jgi:stage IV sporulation protein FB
MTAMRQDAFNLGTWGRIPVSLHWTALLTFAWLYIIFWDVVATLVGAVALFFLFAVHEFGHVFVLRRKRIAVTSIQFSGLHGETAYNEYAAKPGDATAVAWGGVLAQLLVLAIALALTLAVPFASLPLGDVLWPPIATVLIKFNIFLVIIALLPIGPFDGHAAWQVIPRMRARWRRGRKPRDAKQRRPAPAAPAPAPEPESLLSDEQRRELDEEARRHADELLARLARKNNSPTDGKE